MIDVRVIDMPVRIKGTTVLNPDGSYTVLINARHSYFTQRQACRHEMDHIDGGDFDGSDSVDAIEQRAHGGEG